jgi:hypothetical protein
LIIRDALNNFVLSNLHAVVSKGYLATPEKNGKLVTSPRTAWSLELSLDKKETTYDDLLEALRLGLKGFEFK